MSDPNANYPATPETNGTRGRVLTASANDLDPVAKAVTTLSSGDLTLLPVGNADADTIAFVGLPAGWVSPYRVRRVTAATATWATVEG